LYCLRRVGVVRALHSFPTRRSSDLVAVGARAASDAAGGVAEATSWAWAGASVASVVKSAMVMVRVVDFIVPSLGIAASNLIDHFLDNVFLTVAFDPIPPGKHVP